MTHHNPFFPRHGFLFKGGGSQVQQIQSAPIPVPAPPVTSSAPEVLQARQDLAQENLMKKTIKKTIFAGDNSGFQAGAGPAVPPTTYRKLG